MKKFILVLFSLICSCMSSNSEAMNKKTDNKTVTLKKDSGIQEVGYGLPHAYVEFFLGQKEEKLQAQINQPVDPLLKEIVDLKNTMKNLVTEAQKATTPEEKHAFIIKAAILKQQSEKEQ